MDYRRLPYDCPDSDTKRSRADGWRTGVDHRYPIANRGAAGGGRAPLSEPEDVMPTLPPLSADEIERERAAVRPRGYMTAQSPHIPFGFLDPRDFELMAHALLEAEQTSTSFYDLVQLMPQGADAGMDLRLFRENALVGIIQCKRYKSRISSGEILAELVKVALFTLAAGQTLPPGCRYQLWTATTPSRSALDLLAAPTKHFESMRSDQWSALIESVKARLRTLDGLTIEDGDVQTIIAGVSSLSLAHVGPESLGNRLVSHSEVRRRFFREPGDVPEAVDIEPIRARRQARLLKRAANQGRTGLAPFVPPEGLNTDFTTFLDDPAPLFVVLGGSGHGKSTWALRMLESPPSPFTVDLVLGEEIGAEDTDYAETLARLVTRGPDALDGGAAVASRSASRWLSGANRLLIVDGLDRVPAAARPRLRDWVQNTIRLAGDHAVKIVMTTRPEIWEPLAGILERDAIKAIYRPEDLARSAAVSHRLTPLSLQDARRVYQAYGLPAELHGRRPFRTPGLVQQFVALGEMRSVAEISRRDLMESVVFRARSEVSEKGIGRAVADAYLLAFGQSLAGTPDGRVALSEAVDLQGGGATLDAFLHTDLIVLVENALRAEPDEAGEYLVSRALDLDAAVKALDDRKSEPLFVGAVAMAAAALEPSEPDRLFDIVQRLLGEQTAKGPREAAFRIIGELRDQSAYEDLILEAVRDTPNRGHLLAVSNLADLIQDLRLPPDRRLRILLELEDGEDDDDWRTKYWLDPEAMGRFVTPFAHAITAAVRNDPEAAIETLLARQGAGEGRVSITRGLLLEAGALAPKFAFEHVWPLRHGPLRRAMSDLAYLQPIAAARHIAALPPDDIGDRDAIQFLWSIFEASRPKAVPEVAEILAEVAAGLQQRASRSGDLGHLKLIVAGARPLDEAEQLDLLQHWDEFGHEIWWLIAACPIHQEALLDQLVDEAGRGGPHDSSLNSIGSYWSDVTMPETSAHTIERLSRRLEAAIDGAAPSRLRQLSLAAESLLYIDERTPVRSPTLRRLADAFASSIVSDVREPILYFSGSPLRYQPTTADLVAYRDRLFAIVVAHENGDLVDRVIWKISESSGERPSAVDHLVTLCGRVGSDRVLNELSDDSPWTNLSARDLRAELNAALRPGR
ncbi:hypothetical protein D3C71_416520 [compost metagenome]